LIGEKTIEEARAHEIVLVSDVPEGVGLEQRLAQRDRFAEFDPETAR
jgi:hypothetical protein